jgi:predicted nucleic acid-binding protein
VTTELPGRHVLVAIDTSVLIYHLEAHPGYVAHTTQILKAVQSGACQGVVSEISLLELLVQPLRQERLDVADEYEVLLTSFPNLILAPVTRQVILKAAAIRAAAGLKTPDALIIATAMEQGATLIITNDQHLKRVTGIQVACLDD